MGSLVLPASGIVYLDANCFIYSIERIDPYRAILDTLWQAVSIGQFTVVTSELTLLEVLVKPLKVGDATTAATFRTVLRHSLQMCRCYPSRRPYLKRRQASEQQ